MTPRTLLAAPLLALAMACGSDDPDPDPVAPAAVERIERMTDCDDLQAEFDTAESNDHTEFMEIADAQMRAVGCY